MNKYLKKFNEVIEILNKETDSQNKSAGYTLFWKLLIANELDCCWSKEELTEQQEEWLIEEIYDFYMGADYSSMSGIVNAYISTIDELDGIENLIKLSQDDPEDLRDKVIWNLGDEGIYD